MGADNRKGNRTQEEDPPWAKLEAEESKCTLNISTYTCNEKVFHLKFRVCTSGKI